MFHKKTITFFLHTTCLYFIINLQSGKRGNIHCQFIRSAKLKTTITGKVIKFN